MRVLVGRTNNERRAADRVQHLTSRRGRFADVAAVADVQERRSVVVSVGYMNGERDIYRRASDVYSADREVVELREFKVELGFRKYNTW